MLELLITLFEYNRIENVSFSIFFLFCSDDKCELSIGKYVYGIC